MGYTSCCVCKHCFSAGIGATRTCTFDGFRDFLVPGSVGRRTRLERDNVVYEYSVVSTKPTPELRDNVFVRSATAFAKHRKAPYLGHKEVPLLSRWPGFDWYRLNVPDLMHGT